MDVVPVEYGTFPHKFHLMAWLFKFIDGITSSWDCVVWWIFTLLMWIGIWTKLIINRVTPDKVKWYCRGFGHIWQAFMMTWTIISNTYLSVYHRKQCYDPSDIRLAKYLMGFSCNTCEIFEGLTNT